MSDIKIVLPINEKEYIRDCQLMYDKGRADERKRIVADLEERKHKVYRTYSLSENNIDLGITYGLETAIELVRGYANENEI